MPFKKSGFWPIVTFAFAVLVIMASLGAIVSGKVDVRNSLLVLIMAAMLIFVVREISRQRGGYKTSGLTLTDREGRPRALLGVSEDGAPFLRLLDGKKEIGELKVAAFPAPGTGAGGAACRALLGRSADGEPLLTIQGGGEVRLELSFGKAGPGFSLFDDQGRRVVRLPSA